MKLEFLPNLSNGGQFKQVVSDNLVRLFDFDRHEAELLRMSIISEVIQKQKPLSISSLSFIEMINCNLTLRISSDDVGITQENERNIFLDQTIKRYEDMTNLIQPFCVKESEGYQWLVEGCDIDLLLSPSGTW